MHNATKLREALKRPGALKVVGAHDDRPAGRAVRDGLTTFTLRWYAPAPTTRPGEAVGGDPPEGGGVRPGGFCEVDPQMRCVWVMAWEGAARMRDGARIGDVQPPVDRSLQGSSSWLRVAREKAAHPVGPPDAPRGTIARAFPQARAHEPAAAPLAVEPRPADRGPRR